jgi:dihydrofolate reductase
MRRIVAFNHVAADGYFAAPDGSLEWVVPDDQVTRDALKEMPGTDTVLFGRRTFELFEAFWPHVLDDPETAPDPHAPGRRSRETRDMAGWLNDAAKIVFSRTLKKVGWKNTRVVPELDPREIKAMKAGPGKDLILFGSGSIATELTRHGLIDEYRFVVDPVLLGSGRSLINGVPLAARLRFLGAKEYPSGNTMLRYAHAG